MTTTTMKQYEKVQKVLFRWWRDDDNDIPEEHIERLTEAAKDRIREMSDEGCLAGELCHIIYDHENDEEIEYSGWWDITEELPNCA